MTTTVYLWSRELVVEAEFIPGSRGRRERSGLPMEPDEDAYFEIESVAEDGEEIEVDDEQRQEIGAELGEQMRQRQLADMERD